MLGDVWKRVHVWFVPSHHNDFHPHLIAERGLLILFALILGAEGFLVSNVVSLQTGTPSLAATAVAGAASGNIIFGYWSRYVAVPLANVAAKPGSGKIAFFILLGVGAVLMGIIAWTISKRHRHYKPVGYVAGGTMLALTATLIFFNTHILFPYAVRLQRASVAVPIILLAHKTMPADWSSVVFATSTNP